MVLNLKRLALAGAFLVASVPAFAQVPPQVNPLGIDLDPFHLFTPAPAAAPMMAPAAPMGHRMMRHRMMRPMMRKPMMAHRMMAKPMMRKSMMRKPMMAKPMMKKPMMAKPMTDAK